MINDFVEHGFDPMDRPEQLRQDDYERHLEEKIVEESVERGVALAEEADDILEKF